VLLFSPGHFGRGSKDNGNEEGDKHIGAHEQSKFDRVKKS
jgi:hypothetical protein